MSTDDVPPASADSTPKPPKERRERRALVEAMLLEGASMASILATASERFHTSTRTIRKDARLVERRWAREDAKNSTSKRSAVLRRLERLATKAEAGGDLGAAIKANLAVAKVAGFLDRGPSAVALAVGAQGGVHSFADLVRGLPPPVDPEVSKLNSALEDRLRAVGGSPDNPNMGEVVDAGADFLRDLAEIHRRRSVPVGPTTSSDVA
jgi:hypothetical protein